MTTHTRRSGPPQTSAAQELIDSGFSLESDDAPYLHHGLNLADIAHVLDLARRKVIPEDAERLLLQLLLQVSEIESADFPYDPALGEPYNSREHYFAERLGNVAGWLHAGRPRREAARIALRLHLRGQLVELIADILQLCRELCRLSLKHAETLMADQTYLQQAQPSTFGHYLVSFAQPALRDARRLLTELSQINTSSGGAGCVNGTRLQDDRDYVAGLLGFEAVIAHTRDAMWRVDDLIALLSGATSVVSNQSKLAEDLEIFSSNEFDFVDLDDSFSRSSVLMPQKRNPYALSIVRGASGVLIGRLAGFLAVTKSPSARSDNFIFAYGELPRALELTGKVTRLMSGVIRTLKVHPERMLTVLGRGYTQSTDLAEYLTVTLGVDYRTAYLVVGNTVREASKAGIPGAQITAEMINRAAISVSGSSWTLDQDAIAEVLDVRNIVATRTAEGGAAVQAVAAMISDTCLRIDELDHLVKRKTTAFEDAESALLERARDIVVNGRRPNDSVNSTMIAGGTDDFDHPAR